jgi:hypothetical protein
MNKIVLSVVIIAVLAVALFGVTETVFAQTSTPQAPGFGPGMMGGRGGPRGGQGFNGQEGFLHDEMVAAFAAKLGISASDLDARLDKGETIGQIAYAQGMTAEQFNTMWQDARNQAIDQAVKNGKITQQQADWMKQRSTGAAGWGGRGGGRGGFNGNCPYAFPQS